MADVISIVWFLLAVAAVAAIESHFRRRVLDQVQRRMGTLAGYVAAEAPAPPEEIAAAGTPRFVRWSVNELPSAALEVEMRWDERVLVQLRRSMRTDLCFAALYVAMPVLAGLAGEARAPQAGMAAQAAGVLLAVFAVARHALCLHRLGALDAAMEPPPGAPMWRQIPQLILYCFGLLLYLGLLVGLLATGALVPVLLLIKTLTTEATETIISVVMASLSALFAILPVLGAFGLLAADMGPIAHLAGGVMLVAIAVHIVQSVSRTRALMHASGSALLVLRVFGQQQSTEFIFNGLIRAWRYFGHHFTVVDGSLVQASGHHKLGWLSRLGLLLFVLSPVLICIWLEVGASTAWPRTAVALVAVACALAAWVAAPAIVAFACWRIDRRFIRDRDQLLARLRRLDRRPRNFDLTYRHERAMCHNDTWVMTVGEFARRADVVLMDLRGLSASNKGCETEIEFLFDAVAAERIVFLVDDREPAAIDALLARCWQMQDPHSPNVLRVDPELTLYVAHADAASGDADRCALERTLMMRADGRLGARLATTQS